MEEDDSAFTKAKHLLSTSIARLIQEQHQQIVFSSCLLAFRHYVAVCEPLSRRPRSTYLHRLYAVALRAGIALATSISLKTI